MTTELNDHSLGVWCAHQAEVLSYCRIYCTVTLCHRYLCHVPKFDFIGVLFPTTSCIISVLQCTCISPLLFKSILSTDLVLLDLVP